MSRRIGAAILLATVPGTSGCLPADTRPEPGLVHITADLQAQIRDAQLADGTLVFTTDDRWTVTIANLYVSIGNARLDGDNCNEYAEAGYQRILNMRQPGPQKVNQVWGLNACRVGFWLATPQAEEVVPGAGVSNAELDMMTNGIVPTSTPTGITTAQGMAVHIIGRAEKDGTTVSFDWGFSSDVRFKDCQRLVQGRSRKHFGISYRYYSY